MFGRRLCAISRTAAARPQRFAVAKKTSTSLQSRAVVRPMSSWSHVEQGPLDSNKATTAAYKADPSPLKINLGEGIYKGDDGKTVVLPSIRKAEERLFNQQLDHDYSPITGSVQFNEAVQKLLYGADHPKVTGGHIVTAQALSGTGSLRVGAEFAARWWKGEKIVYVSDPTWVNHFPLFGHAGFEVRQHRYYNSETQSLDIPGMLEDLKNAPNGSIICLHAAAHNPTGADPTHDEWVEISRVMLEKGHLAFFDAAYQGFASGDPDNDAFAVRHFMDAGHSLISCQSFAKSCGLYGERVGALSVVTDSKAEAEAVDSQVKIVIRPMYSNPPLYGARLVHLLLTDDELNALWRNDIKDMSTRIRTMRQTLVDSLATVGSQRDWSHITRQIGMFAYSGLKPDEVQEIIKEHHVYMNKDGRVSMSGVNSGNVERLASAIHAVTSK